MPIRPPKPSDDHRSPRKEVCISDIIDDDEDFEDITGLASPPPGVCPSTIVDEDEDSGWGNGGF